METVTIDRTHRQRLDPYALHNMFRLRHSVFRERLGWSVPSQQGLERDGYDGLEPVYLVARGTRRQVTGCLRLLPTTGPYMLRDTFPELLAGEQAPADPCIWDVSRFAVARDQGAAGPGGSVRDVTVELVRSVIDHGLEQGITQYVAVVSVAFERILRRIGLTMQRFGDGRPRYVGDTLSVALWIEVSPAARAAIASTPTDQPQPRSAA